MSKVIDEQGLFVVTRDGRTVFGPGSHNECWAYLHKTSSGVSVEWRCRYEGYAISPARVSQSETIPQTTS